MCGIAGQARNDGRPVARALVDAMCAAMRHRGPDSQGVYLDDAVGLGIQRLRIIDLVSGEVREHLLPPQHLQDFTGEEYLRELRSVL